VTRFPVTVPFLPYLIGGSLFSFPAHPTIYERDNSVAALYVGGPGGGEVIERVMKLGFGTAQDAGQLTQRA
jgi:hypothetical protein